MEGMTASGEIGELAKALAAAQAEMGDAAKDGKNPHFRSSYATLAEVRRVVVPALAKHGIAVTQLPAVTDGGVEVTTVLMHSSGQYVSSKLTMPVKDRAPQAVGSAITYGRRYALAAVACVAADEDDDGEAAMGRGGRQGGSQSVPRAQGGGSAPSEGAKAFLERLEAAETADDLAALSEEIVRTKLPDAELASLREAFGRRLAKVRSNRPHIALVP